jgi:hypothetical protein
MEGEDFKAQNSHVIKICKDRTALNDKKPPV